MSGLGSLYLSPASLKGHTMRLQALIATITLSTLASYAAAGDGFSVSTYSIAGGGGVHVNGPYSLTGNSGQPVAGAAMMGGGFSLTSGFPQTTSGSPPCPADINGDGELNFFDVSAFLGAYTSMLPSADFTGDGIFNFFDVSAFLGAYSTGCP